MKKMDAMYIVTTPFQIMSAISLCVNHKEKADLYIDAQFEGADELAEKIRDRGIFDTVVVLNSVSAIESVRNAKGRTSRYRNLVRVYTHLDENVKEILIPDRKYIKMYATHGVFIANLLMLYFSKEDILTRTIFFDDGEGSYDNRDMFRTSALAKAMTRMVLKAKKLRMQKRYYMYAPDLFIKMYPKNVVPVLQLPKFNQNEKVLEHLKAIFEIDDSKGIREPVVILDALKEACLSKKDDERLVRFYDRLQAEFGDENLIVKRHPRDYRTYENPIRTYPYPTMPFEIICLASDPQNMVLITLLSTATIMPKLLLDAEPEIVLLYHLYDRLEGNDEDRDAFFDHMRQIYSEPEKIVIPDTEEEMDQVIEAIREKIASKKNEG